MYNHAPANYQCPFCLVASGRELDSVPTKQSDIILRTENVLAFVASSWWPRNAGHVLVVPTNHFENIYDLPDEVGASIYSASRKIAIVMKSAYGCDGISTRQHNEPAGYQEVWHYHLHLFPRYANDNLYLAYRDGRAITADERKPYAARLRLALGKSS